MKYTINIKCHEVSKYYVKPDFGLLLSIFLLIVHLIKIIMVP